MAEDNSLDKIKKLREMTGAGFKDCGIAIKENKGDIEKSIEYLRIKGISKASKKMDRSANEGLICITNNKESSSIIEINCETDFVAKNDEYINFCEEISQINFNEKGKIENLNKAKMQNGDTVEKNLINFISKIGEKITLGKCDYINESKSYNFTYIHNSLKKNIGKLGVIVSIETDKLTESISDFGKKLTMHIAATNPIALDIKDIEKNILDKEKTIINEELKNTGKPNNIIEKISQGKIQKFKEENTLLNQYWVMDNKKKVKEIIQELNAKIIIKRFLRYKIGS